MSDSRTLKICLAASSGGHASQLLKLAECWHGYNASSVTTTDLVSKQFRQYGRVYIVGECNRRHPIRVIVVLMRCIKAVVREKPDVVIQIMVERMLSADAPPESSVLAH